MLSRRQVFTLSLVAVVFWAGATAAIRFCPAALTKPVWGNIGFLTSIPVCWLCVVAAQRWAVLGREQLVAGTAFVVALAMLIDACALRWAHFVYGADGAGGFFRLASAWLFWGYGVSLAMAIAMAYARRLPAVADEVFVEADR